jgi:hypothetical protein
MAIIRKPGEARRSAAVVKARQDEKTERQAVKALQQDLQTINTEITPQTTLAQLRKHVQDHVTITRRLLRLLA